MSQNNIDALIVLLALFLVGVGCSFILAATSTGNTIDASFGGAFIGFNTATLIVMLMKRARR